MPTLPPSAHGPHQRGLQRVHIRNVTMMNPRPHLRVMERLLAGVRQSATKAACHPSVDDVTRTVKTVDRWLVRQDGMLLVRLRGLRDQVCLPVVDQMVSSQPSPHWRSIVLGIILTTQTAHALLRASEPVRVRVFEQMFRWEQPLNYSFARMSTGLDPTSIISLGNLINNVAEPSSWI